MYKIFKLSKKNILFKGGAILSIWISSLWRGWKKPFFLSKKKTFFEENNDRNKDPSIFG